MTRVKLPCMSVEASGSLGGIEFKHTQYGNVVGRRSIAARSATRAQCAHRALLAPAHSAWNALPSTLQAEWDRFAPHHSTGRLEYTKRHVLAFQIGETPPTLPTGPTTQAEIHNYGALYSHLYPNQLEVWWEFTGPGTTRLLTCTHSTWKKQSLPDIPHLAFRKSHLLSWDGDMLPIPHRAPHIYVLFKLICPNTINLIASYYLEATQV